MEDLDYITTIDIYHRDGFTIANQITYNQNLIFNKGDKIIIQFADNKEKTYFVGRKILTLKLGLDIQIPLRNENIHKEKDVLNIHYDLKEFKGN